MTLVKWNPNRSLISDFDRIFDNMKSVVIVPKIDEAYPTSSPAQRTSYQFWRNYLTNVAEMNYPGRGDTSC